jgi:hypothetical protein
MNIRINSRRQDPLDFGLRLTISSEEGPVWDVFADRKDIPRLRKAIAAAERHADAVGEVAGRWYLVEAAVLREALARLSAEPVVS